MRQRSEQYLTSSQTFSHFLRHVKGRLQVAQVLVGKSDFLRMPITKSSLIRIEMQGWQ